MEQHFANAKVVGDNQGDKKDGVLITGLPFNTDYSDISLNNLISDMQSWKKTRMIGSAAMASCYIAAGKAEVDFAVLRGGLTINLLWCVTDSVSSSHTTGKQWSDHHTH